jgi:hypothetical protein
MLRRVAVTAALAALMAPAGVAEAAKKTKKVKLPVVTSVSPMEAAVGDTLTVHGRHFRRGMAKNQVVFKRDGARAVFVKADVATRKQLKVVVPKRLEDVMLAQGGALVPTTFRLRILSNRFGKSFTAVSKSPTLGPERPPAPPEAPVADAEGDCDGDGVLNRDDADDDNDLLDDELEARIKTDPCKRDSDGDGVEDGYEYRSAIDLNEDEFQDPNRSLPYPSKRPYPNPLDGKDADVDHDGDTLTLKEEYDLWVLTVNRGATRSLDALSYSAGLQHSVHERRSDGRRRPALAAAGYDRHQDFLTWAQAAGYRTVHLADVGDWWYGERTAYSINDFNRDGEQTGRDLDFSGDGVGYLRSEATYYDADQDGWLTDGERDEDADGLTNFDETRGCMSGEAWWSAVYDKETPYPPMVDNPGTRHDDPDSDGDGIRDGADDSDFDDLPNVMECRRQAASGRVINQKDDPVISTPAKGFVQPFNPCLPSIRSRTCNRNPSVTDAWAPFNADDKYYFVFH